MYLRVLGQRRLRESKWKEVLPPAGWKKAKEMYHKPLDDQVGLITTSIEESRSYLAIDANLSRDLVPMPEDADLPTITV